MSEHELKCWPEYFDAILSGAKPFELRKNDRSYALGDVLFLREWDESDGYSGRETRCRVTYILEGGPFARHVEAGYVIMGLAPAIAAAERAVVEAARKWVAHRENLSIHPYDSIEGAVRTAVAALRAAEEQAK